jgi:prevent-host-death family protein
MGKTWALQDAKNRFSEVVDRAMEDGPQLVTRHGREAVVVVSAAEYRKMTQPTESQLEIMQRSPLYGSEDIEFTRDKSLTREQSL